MCYDVTNSTDGAFSRTGAFNFVRRKILKLPKGVLLNEEYVMTMFNQDGSQMFLKRPEEVVEEIANTLGLRTINDNYFSAKKEGRLADAFRIFQEGISRLNYSINNYSK